MAAALDLLKSVAQEQGALAVGLVIACLVFYKLIWRVWDATIKSKDEEICRLVKERDRYQEIFFERFVSSSIDSESTANATPRTPQESPPQVSKGGAK